MPELEINPDGSLKNKEDATIFEPIISMAKRHTCQDCAFKNILCPLEIISICESENVIFKKKENYYKKPNEYGNLD